MKQIFLWFVMLLVVAAVSVVAADSPTLKPSEPAPVATNAPGQQVIAYYFHGTVRCETCLKIEQQAKAVIERKFKAELDAHRLVFKPVNYDLPENAHFLLDYKLPCPSLVLVRQPGGKDDKWTLLGGTWQLVEDPVKFNAYIETEVNKFLSIPQ
ncbi:MAG: nitrophenyl compound nitroreductase subunit ArsF family protein [Limisphaerales bacterium]